MIRKTLSDTKQREEPLLPWITQSWRLIDRIEVRETLIEKKGDTSCEVHENHSNGDSPKKDRRTGEGPKPTSGCSIKGLLVRQLLLTDQIVIHHRPLGNDGGFVGNQLMASLQLTCDHHRQQLDYFPHAASSGQTKLVMSFASYPWINIFTWFLSLPKVI